MSKRLSSACLLSLFGVFAAGTCAGQTNSQTQATLGVVERFIGPRASEIVFQSIAQTNNCDVYEYVAQGGVLTVRGSGAVAMCRGFYDYFKANGMGICSWASNRVALPAQWPDAALTRVATPFRHHCNFNVVTYGYTMPFWDWARWERELDWMALHGLDMPLALAATEAIGTRVWQQLGLTQSEIDAFYTGPAYLPWQRMGNITGWTGPLNASWHTNQIALQHQVLDRMRSLGMKPIAPAFAGFVPAAITNHYAGLALTPMSWGGFSTQYRAQLMLPNTASNTALFTDIGRRYIQAWEQEFGKNRYFLADSFNEMTISGTAAQQAAMLRQLSTNLYQSIVAGNSNAVWVLQGWMFGYQRSQWTTNNVGALLSAPPNDQMLILDMACDYNALIWNNGYDFDLYRGFFGKEWAYSTIPNMGGKTAFTGKLNYYATGVTNALNSANRGNLVACGMASEGTENNEALYELCTDAGWSGQPLALNAWLQFYCQTRYGAYPQAMSNAWQQLQAGVYSWFDDHPRYAWQVRPSLSPSGTVYTGADFIEAARQFLAASDTLGNTEPYRSDAIEIAALALGVQAQQSLQTACSAHSAGNYTLRDSAATNALQLLRTADRLLESHPNLRLQRWVNFARNQGTTPAERDNYEANSRRILTAWGGGIVDYSCRVWSGLIRDYYVPRWEAFFNSLRTGQSVNWTALEEAWITRPGISQVSPYADPLAVAKQALAVPTSSTNISLLAYLNGEDSSSPLDDQADGTTAAAVGSGHAYALTGAAEGTYGAIILTNSLGNAIGISGSSSGAWDYSLADSAKFNALVNNFTVMCWLYVPAGGVPSNGDTQMGLFGTDQAWSAGGWGLGVRNGGAGHSNTVVYTSWNISDYYAPNNLLRPGVWQHIAITKGSTSGVVFYTNGVACYTNASGTTDVTAASKVYGLCRYLYGTANMCMNNGMLVDEFRIYNGVMAASNIVSAARMNYTPPPPSTNTTPLFADLPVPPYFESQPQNANVNTGDTLNLSAAVNGDPVIAYQWFAVTADGSVTNVITDATNAVLFIPNVTTIHSGTYYLVASNSMGTSTSVGAVVQVSPPTPPLLTQDLKPQTLTAYQGASVTFSVQVAPASSAPLTYLWQSNGVIIAVTTDVNFFTLTNLPWSATNGIYSVTVTNLSGSTNSRSASLSLIPGPADAYGEFLLAERPVAWWRLNETYGTVAHDYIAGNDGTLYGGATFGTPGSLTNDADTAASFDGSTGYIEVPWSATINPAQFTIECWARVTGGAGTYRAPICSRAGAPNAGYIFYATSDNNWGFWTGLGGSTAWNMANGSALITNEWAHLVGTCDTGSGEMVFYVNGIQVAAITNTLIYANSSRPLRIGASATEGTPQFFFRGDLDEVAIYAKQLSSAQVQQHYLLGKQGLPVVQISLQSSDAVLTWPVGTLQSADTVSGPYSDVTGAVSPWTNTLPASQMFFRVRY